MERKHWSKLLFALYCVMMLWLLFGQRIGHWPDGTYWELLRDNLNLRPWDTVNRYLWVLKYSANQAQIRHAVVNLGGNVVMFVPLGFLAPCIWGKLRKFGWHLLTMVLTIVTVELMQLFSLLGKCDVDDLLLNLVGTTMGFALWKLFKWIVK